MNNQNTPSYKSTASGCALVVKLRPFSTKRNGGAYSEDKSAKDSQIPVKPTTAEGARVNDQNHNADPTRKSFLDLAGEIRNQIYELVLADSIAVEAVYRPTLNKFYVPDRRYLSHHTVPQNTMRNLQALLHTNRTVRSETRSFYYANNSFDVAHEGVRFLRAIGPVSRTNISSLRLDEVYSPKPLPEDLNTKSQELLLLLEQCANLEQLSIVLPLKLELRVDLAWKDLIATVDVSAVTNFFSGIKCLKSLEIILVFSKPSGVVISAYRRYRLEEGLGQAVHNALSTLYPQTDVSVSASLSYKWQ